MRLRGIHWIPAFAGMTYLLIAVLVQAEECAFKDGGYCVSMIAKKIGTVVTPSAGRQPSSIEVVGESGVAYLNYYEDIWDEMVKNGKATMLDRERVFEQASIAGGTKIGGVNLVVLSAGTLQQLVGQKVLTRDEAQGILNGAKVDGRLPRPSGSQ